MSRFWIVACLPFLILARAASSDEPASAPTAPPQPVLVAEQEDLDAGEVVAGEVARFTFTLVNRGPETLKLKAMSSCGCTVARLDPEVAPGARTTLEAAMDTKSLNGKVAKSVTVRADPGGRMLQLHVRATVRPLVRVQPASAQFVVVKDRVPNRVEFTLVPEPGRGIEFKEAVSSDPHFLPRLVPGEGGTTKLVVAVTPDAPPGHLQTNIVVVTNSPIAPRIPVLITGERGITCSPRMLYWATMPSDRRTMQDEIMLRKRGGRFAIRSVHSDDPALRATVETVEAGTQYRVVVVYSGGWKPGNVRQQLTIETDDLFQPVITIPVQATVSAAAAQ
jgi:hypothetical protein